METILKNFEDSEGLLVFQKIPTILKIETKKKNSSRDK
jgi:hypothetical protein